MLPCSHHNVYESLLRLSLYIHFSLFLYYLIVQQEQSPKRQSNLECSVERG